MNRPMNSYDAPEFPKTNGNGGRENALMDPYARKAGDRIV